MYLERTNANEYQSSHSCRLTGKEAWSRSAPNGKSVTRLSVATTKRYKDAEGGWREKTQWYTCVAYGPIVGYAAKLQTGTHVLLEGELITASVTAPSKLNQDRSECHGL